MPSVLQSTFHAQACEELFKHLCISGTPKIRLHAGLLLVQLCGGERWWGQFLSNVLQELYNSEQLLIFPQDRYGCQMEQFPSEAAFGLFFVGYNEVILKVN